MTRKVYMSLTSIKNEAYLAKYMDKNDKRAQSEASFIVSLWQLPNTKSKELIMSF